MRNVKMTALIGESFDRTLDILFRPFSTKKWLRLTLIALLAGMLLGVGGSSGGNNRNAANKETGKAVSKDLKTADAVESKAGSAPAGSSTGPEAARRNSIIVAVIAITIIAFIIFSIFFAVFMTWVGARFKFVWLNAVINNTDAIIEPYSRHRREGNSFFRLSLVVFIALLMAIILFIGIVIYGMINCGVFQKGFEWTPIVALKIFLAPALTGIIFLIALSIFGFLADHFVVPIMAFDECTAMQALKKLRAILDSNWKDFALFTLVFFLLSIVAGMFAGILAILAIIVLSIAAAVIFGLPFLLLWLALKAKTIFIIYAIAAGIPFIFAVIALLLVISLPFAVFFRIFSLKYLLNIGALYGSDSLQKYSAKKAVRLSGRVPVITGIITVFLLISTLVCGLLAAIVIPNLISAREGALEKRVVTEKNST